MTWFTRKGIKLVDAQFGTMKLHCLGLDDQGNMYVWGSDSDGSIGDYTGDYYISMAGFFEDKHCVYRVCWIIRVGVSISSGKSIRGVMVDKVNKTGSMVRIPIPIYTYLRVII